MLTFTCLIPSGIGVFGHWSHYLSEYSIQVFLDASAVFSEEQVKAIERASQGIGEGERQLAFHGIIDHPILFDVKLFKSNFILGNN
ncbi:hypothetical protein HF086_007756 [Spodoptera exigua]|uniref:Uncharacterized protein n=1 Tax=Spodoptera exigua TaxID=7107 RepID=A0A922ML25_SPOEX|nr:hypothetical protein HF086_007756 [Spodoptera exigua]